MAKYVIKHMNQRTEECESIITFEELTTNSIYKAVGEWKSPYYKLPTYQSIFEFHCNDGRVLTVPNINNGIKKLRDSLLAENAKVWCESLHSYVSAEVKCEFEADCYDWTHSEYVGIVMNNIYADIYGSNPNTDTRSDELDTAIVKDDDIAQICREVGCHVTKCQEGDWENDPIYHVTIKNTDTEREGENMENLTYDYGTREWCFEGSHVHAYYQDIPCENGGFDCTFFAVDDGGKKVNGATIETTLTDEEFQSICKDIESNPSKYVLKGWFDYTGYERFVLARKTEDGAFEYLESNGDWVLESEDDFDKDAHVIAF